MKVINVSNNTLYADDVDVHIPFQDTEPYTIEPDLLKRSRCIRNFIIHGMLDVKEYDEHERIETSVVYLRNKQSETPKPQPVETIHIPALNVCKQEMEIKIQGIFFDASGYGKVNRNLATSLAKMGYAVKIAPKQGFNHLNEDEISEIAKLQNTVISPRHILIDSVIPSFAEPETGVYKILSSTIEAHSVPDQFKKSCNFYDEIWLNSEWASSTLRKYTNKPVHTIPSGADPELYTEDGPKFNFKPNIKKFVFVSVFGWNYRKGYDVLLKAYFDEFDADDDVSLLLVSRYQTGNLRTQKNKIKDDIEQIMKQFPNKDLPHLVRYSNITPEKDMPKIYRACNAFILPTRGESFCLPPVEASLCGLPVIMTDCSGQQEYLRKDNAYLIDIDYLEIADFKKFNIHYWDGQQFPSLTSKSVHEQTKQLMRHVVNNQEEARNRNRKLQNLILNKYTWNHSANAASKRLQEISQKLKG